MDASTVEQTKSLIVNSLACAIAAFDEPPVRICRDIALAPANGPSTVIGTRRRTTPDLAGFANGAAIRYYDLNDAYASPTSGAVHPSDHIGACLAVAEAEKASAADAITAIVLAYEINCRLVDSLDSARRGWDTTIFSLPAVALAAGKLMKLPRERLVQAVNLALNDHVPMGQTRTQTNSDWKGLADAEAERNAVFAAQLARGGLTGPAPIFEGRKGFFQLVATPADVDVAAFGGRNARFRIHDCGVKTYPAVVYSQTAIAAGIELTKEIGSGDRITSLEIATTARGYEQAGRDREKWTPQTRDTADHSLPYLTARAVVDGDIAPGDLRRRADARSRDPGADAEDHREGGSSLRQAEGQCAGDPSHRHPGRRSDCRTTGRRHAGFSRPADEPRRNGPQVPQQCRRPLAGKPCRCAPAGAVELRADRGLALVAGPAFPRGLSRRGCRWHAIGPWKAAKLMAIARGRTT